VRLAQLIHSGEERRERKDIISLSQKRLCLVYHSWPLYGRKGSVTKATPPFPFVPPLFFFLTFLSFTKRTHSLASPAALATATIVYVREKSVYATFDAPFFIVSFAPSCALSVAIFLCFVYVCVVNDVILTFSSDWEEGVGVKREWGGGLWYRFDPFCFLLN